MRYTVNGKKTLNKSKWKFTLFEKLNKHKKRWDNLEESRLMSLKVFGAIDGHLNRSIAIKGQDYFLSSQTNRILAKIWKHSKESCIELFSDIYFKIRQWMIVLQKKLLSQRQSKTIMLLTNKSMYFEFLCFAWSIK